MSSSNLTRLVVSPISSKIKKKHGTPCARTDFNEQRQRKSETINGDYSLCWDDTDRNLAKVGDYFAFWLHDGKYREGTNCAWVGGHFTFHRILEVRSPESRLPSWSKNVGQTNRNVLTLSSQIISMSFDTVKGYYGLTPDYHRTHYAKSGFNDRETALKYLLDYLS